MSNNTTVTRKNQFFSGIPGFEKVTPKKIPNGFWVALVGPPGTFKTILSIASLEFHMSRGAKCIYVSTEEPEKDILNQAEAFGYKWREKIASGDLVIIDWQEHLQMLLGDKDKTKGIHLKFVDVILAERKKWGIATEDAMMVIDSVVTLWEDMPQMAMKMFRYVRRRLQKFFNQVFIVSQMASSTNRAYGASVEHIVDGIIRTGNYVEDGYLKTWLMCVKMRELAVNRALLSVEVDASGPKIHERIEMRGRYSTVYDAFSEGD